MLAIRWSSATIVCCSLSVRPCPTYADLATALLDSLTRPDLYRQIAYVAN